jgi:hypothetical protein
MIDQEEYKKVMAWVHAHTQGMAQTSDLLHRPKMPSLSTMKGLYYTLFWGYVKH